MAKEYLMDATDMEPPEPLIHTLEMLGDLKEGDYLRFLHRREPLPLYDNLNQAGFSYITCADSDVAYEVFISNKDDIEAQATIQSQIQSANLKVHFSSISNLDS